MQYRLGRRDAEGMFPARYPGRTALLDEAARRRRQSTMDGPWRFKKVGGSFTKAMPWIEIRQVADKRLAGNAKNQDPDRFYLRHERSGTIFILQEVEAAALADPPSGAVGFWHPAIVTAYRVSFGDEFQGQTEFWGAYNCRRNVLNEALWSMHSDWPPVLAIDIGCSPATAERLKTAIKKAAPKADWVFVYHFGHLHAQVGSNRTGTPGCA
jgi:hypothetical protein